jgi:hypothetical protein
VNSTLGETFSSGFTAHSINAAPGGAAGVALFVDGAVQRGNRGAGCRWTDSVGIIDLRSSV